MLRPQCHHRVHPLLRNEYVQCYLYCTYTELSLLRRQVHWWLHILPHFEMTIWSFISGRPDLLHLLVHGRSEYTFPRITIVTFSIIIPAA